MASRNDPAGLDADGVLEAARAIRPFLTGLVGPTAQRVDARLSELLNEQRPQAQVVVEVKQLLDSDQTTADFLVDVLDDAPYYRPPEVQLGAEDVRGVEPLPGEVGPVAAAGKYACPYGDFVWYRNAVGVPEPPCPTPTHGPLVRI